MFLESLETRVVLTSLHDLAVGHDDQPAAVSTDTQPPAVFAAEGEHDGQQPHIHVQLTLFVDGTEVTIPSNIGVGESGFLSQVHTHDDSGELHIHAITTEPRDQTLALGDFFDTWRTNAGVAGNNPNARLSPTQLFDNVTDTTNTLQMFVNGQISEEFDDLVFHDGDDVILVYGSNPVVSLNTNFGSIVIEMFETETPGTVANFLNYVNDGDYINSFFHRSADSGSADFVIQGGGFRTTSTTFTSTAQFSSVPTDPPIQNEPGISNVRGTVAMAKTSDPNSATSQFFVNLNDANTFLDNPSNSGGFTVFGQVLDLRSSDQIAALPTRNEAPPYGELPVSADNQLVVIQSIVGRGEISGIHFNDDNRNGALDPGESAIAGATIYIDANNNAMLDAGELATATDADGRYLFQLDPGAYTVRAEFDSDLALTVPSTSDRYNVTVEIGREVTDRDFGVAEDNANPLTQSDTYSVNEDAVLTVTAANGVLANDTSQTSAALTAEVDTQPANGTLTLGGDGSFTYTPNANFFGSDTFTYIASDGTNHSSATTVTVTVGAQPDPPTAVADSVTFSNSRTPRTIDVLANDTSAPDAAQTLTVTSVTQGTAGGTVTLAGGGVSYLAPEGFIGADSFSYTIEDTDGLTSSATVTVNVTEVANNRLSGFVYIDANGDGLRNTGEIGVPGAQITLTGAGLTRTILTDASGAYAFEELPAGTYQLAERQPTAMLDGIDSTTVPNAIVGDDQITEVALDGGQEFAENNFGELGIHSQYVSIAWFFASADSPEVMFRETIAMGEQTAGDMALADTIRAGGTEVPEATNSAPVASGDAFTVDENSVLTVTAASGVLSNDTDVDGDSLTAVVLTQPSHGTLSFSGNGSFTYTPNTDFLGTDSFTYQASDATALSNTATVTITVTEDQTDVNNEAPVAATDNYSVDENTTLTVSSASGVLSNDSDADGDSLTAQQATPPANGTLSLSADGSLTYTPDTDFTGTDTFTYSASDGSLVSTPATVTITVRSVNAPPVTTNDSYTLEEDSSLTVDAASGVLVNDSDPEGAALTAVLVDPPQSGTISLNADGSFTYTPVANFSASDAFTYAASDGERTSGATTVTLLVQGLEDVPVAVSDSYSVDQAGTLNVTAANGLLANDSDADADTLTALLLANPANGTLTLNANGSFSYAPHETFVGTDTFTYQADDGFFVSNTVTVTITVAPADLVRVRLEATTTGGTPIDTIGVGQSFFVNAFVEDLRQVPKGVFAAYVDVTYNSDVASTDGAIVYSTDFANGRSGSTATAGLVDEVGAFTQAMLGGGEALVFSIPLVANAAGSLDLMLDAADQFPAHDTLLHGINTAVPLELLDFVSASVSVVAANAEGEAGGLAAYAASADEAFAAEDNWLA